MIVCLSILSREWISNSKAKMLAAKMLLAKNSKNSK